MLPRSSYSLALYRQQLSLTPSLSASEEQQLALACHRGDSNAGARLIQAALPFVVRVAFEYRRWGIPMDDLIQQGNVGLIKAVQKFEPHRNIRLVTYAVFWIRAEIRDYVVRTYRLVRIGTTKGERKAVRQYRKTREDNVEKLSQLSGLPVEQVEKLLPILKSHDVSLDNSLDNEPSMMDRLVGDESSAEDALAHAENAQRLEQCVQDAIAKLPEREAFIIRERMLLDEPSTLESLGLKLGISKERVRQLEERARKRLRVELSSLHHAA